MWVFMLVTSYEGSLRKHFALNGATEKMKIIECKHGIYLASDEIFDIMPSLSVLSFWYRLSGR